MSDKAAKFFQFERADDALVLIPRSNLDEIALQQIYAEADEVLKTLDQALGTSIVIDCKNTDFFSSSALGFFMKLWLRVRVRNGKMAFCIRCCRAAE